MIFVVGFLTVVHLFNGVLPLFIARLRIADGELMKPEDGGELELP